MSNSSQSDPLARRFAAIIQQHGGVADLVRRSGLAKQVVYRALKGTRSFVVLEAIAEHYTDVDLRWLVTGKATEGNQLVTSHHDPLVQTIIDLVDDPEDGDLARARLEGFLAGLGVSFAEKKRRTGS